jgi:hypothetical protein
MKIIITENKKKEAIYKYFDKVKAKGELPSIQPFLSFFEVGFWDSEEYYHLIMDYYGGFDNAVELSKKIALGLKDVPFQSGIRDGNLFFTINKVYLSHHELEVDVDCYGELFNMVIYNEEEDRDEIVERISLSDYYDLLEDISESSELRDLIGSDISDVLVKEITYKTGIECSIDYIFFT